MNYKNSITVTSVKENRYDNTSNKKLLIPMEIIKGVQQIQEKDYGAAKVNDDYPITNFTIICIDPKFALDNNLCDEKYYKSFYHGDRSPFPLKIKEDFTIICGLIKGDKAAEVLFNE